MSIDGRESVTERRNEAEKRFLGELERIYEKYGDTETLDQGDVVDMSTGEIIEDRGHLRGLEEPGQGSIWSLADESRKKRRKPSTWSVVDLTPTKGPLDEDAFDNLLTPPPSKFLFNASTFTFNGPKLNISTQPPTRNSSLQRRDSDSSLISRPSDESDGEAEDKIGFSEHEKADESGRSDGDGSDANINYNVPSYNLEETSDSELSAAHTTGDELNLDYSDETDNSVQVIENSASASDSSDQSIDDSDKSVQSIDDSDNSVQFIEASSDNFGQFIEASSDNFGQIIKDGSESISPTQSSEGSVPDRYPKAVSPPIVDISDDEEEANNANESRYDRLEREITNSAMALCGTRGFRCLQRGCQKCRVV